MTPRIGVVAPEHIAWIRAAASSLVVADTVAGARLLVTTADRVDELAARVPRTPLVVVGDPTRVVDQRVAHVIRRGLSSQRLSVLLESLAGRRTNPPRPADPETPAALRSAQRAFQVSRRLAGASDLAEAEAVAVSAVAELAGADRAHCLFHDPADGSIWSEARMRQEGDDRRAIAGLVGFAARTGMPARVDRAGRDRRWVAAIDDPGGDPDQRLLVQPIASASGAIHVVLVAVRSARRPPFSYADADVLARYAALAAPFVDQLSSQHEARASLEHDGQQGPFRAEAVAAHGQTRWGAVIRVVPRWMGWTYWLLLALVALGVLCAAVGRVSTYSGGPALIRATARAALVARTAGNVTAIERAPGDQVAAGTVIARLDDQAQRAAFDLAVEEFDSQLRNHMLDPSDPVADAAVRQLRQTRDAARAALEDRLVRATSSGTIADLRVQRGQHVQPGDIVATIAEGSSAGALELVALLPGKDRPQLAAGMPLRLELHGYRYAYQSLVVDSVSSDVIGPTEARRVLGPGMADSLPPGGPVVLVRARLPRDVFEADGRTFRYHDGMLGVAEVRTRTDRVLFAILPWLRRL
jgi:biotin carboxyl carrier protein